MGVMNATLLPRSTQSELSPVRKLQICLCCPVRLVVDSDDDSDSPPKKRSRKKKKKNKNRDG